MNKDSLLLGLMLGLVVPLLGVMVFYSIRYIPQHISFNEFLYLMKANHQNIAKILSLGMIAYIPLITYYKNRFHYTTLKGIFAMLLFYVALIVCYKFNIL
jgi:hypothetical protein